MSIKTAHALYRDNGPLKEYISLSETLRSRSGQFVSKLFLSFISSHNPVFPRTIARWIMLVFQSAGIDIHFEV